jgi:hypothetical protein
VSLLADCLIPSGQYAQAGLVTDETARGPLFARDPRKGVNRRVTRSP